MSFTAGSTGGKYKRTYFQGSGGGYGLASSDPISYGGRVPIFPSQYGAGVQIPFEFTQPYITVYFFRRTA